MSDDQIKLNPPIKEQALRKGERLYLAVIGAATVFSSRIGGNLQKYFTDFIAISPRATPNIIQVLFSIGPYTTNAWVLYLKP